MQAGGGAPHEVAETWTPEEFMMICDALLDQRERESNTEKEKPGERWITLDQMASMIRSGRGN